MRKLYLFLTGTVTILSFATSLFAADIGVTGIGARATSLGTSYRAISDDWSGMYWNPAGINQIDGWHFGLGAELLLPVGSYKPALWDDSTFSITRQTETRSEPKGFFVPSLGVVRKLFEKFTIGLGVWVPLGMGAKWDLLDTAGYNSAFPEYDYEIDLKTVDIHPTVAFKLNDRISIGAGIGLVYANILIQQPLFFQNPYVKGEIKGFGVYEVTGSGLQDSLEAAGGLISEFNHLVAESEFAISGFGYSANCGVMAKINDQLQIGISGHYYGDVKLKGKLNALLYHPANAQAQQYLDSVWGDTTSVLNRIDLLNAAVSSGEIKEYEKNAILNAYKGGTSLVYTDADAELTLPLPADVGIGISYKVINENDRHLIVSSDFQYTFASVWKVFDIDINDGEDAFQFVQNWNNSFRLSFGIEFKINPVWTLRSAYYYEKNAGVTETLTPIFPDINPRSSVNLGFQYTIKPNITLHCGYEGIFFGEQSFDNWVYNDENRFYDNMAGTYNYRVNNFMLGLDFNF
ncbi:MAG: outer membrane protein transport protein [Chitinispirillaceae bacterium]|nr:outer membrane protein transport protein [Chitinispirillaceae bacterium]